MALTTETIEYYDVDGNLLHSIETEVDVPTTEELIAKKEQELLDMYNELNALKAQLGE